MKYIVGHQNPDTDSVAAAIALADLLGDNYKPAIAGKLNKESKYVLNLLELAEPMMVPSDSDAYVLVDHNALCQISPNIEIEKIEMIIDHHKLGGLSLQVPIKVITDSVGSTCTLIYNLFKEKQKKISKKQAGLMLAGIISDTLNFKSPTTTDIDIAVASELEKISELNRDIVAGQMFEAKSDLTGISTEEIIGQDYKNFDLGCKKVGFGVFETVSPDPALKRIKEISTALREKKQVEKVDYMFFAIVDIVGEMAYLTLLSKDEEDLATGAYGGSVEDGYMVLPGVVSRKKQMTPALEKTLKDA
jgi:manganese-dependent inorganic pyrophosphatase